MSERRDREIRTFEDMLAKQGLPCLCREVVGGDGLTEQNDDLVIGEPLIEVVFPINKERHLFDFARNFRPLLLELFGPDFGILPRTILHNLAYSRFGLLSSKRDEFFLSTNIENLKDPDVYIRKHLHHYYYTVKEVVVDLTAKVHKLGSLQKSVIRVANAFNKESRYLKIKELWIAYTNSNVVRAGDPPLKYTQLALDERYLVFAK